MDSELGVSVGVCVCGGGGELRLHLSKSSIRKIVEGKFDKPD